MWVSECEYHDVSAFVWLVCFEQRRLPNKQLKTSSNNSNNWTGPNNIVASGSEMLLLFLLSFWFELYFNSPETLFLVFVVLIVLQQHYFVYLNYGCRRCCCCRSWSAGLKLRKKISFEWDTKKIFYWNIFFFFCESTRCPSFLKHLFHHKFPINWDNYFFCRKLIVLSYISFINFNFNFIKKITTTKCLRILCFTLWKEAVSWKLKKWIAKKKLNNNKHETRQKVENHNKAKYKKTWDESLN